MATPALTNLFRTLSLGAPGAFPHFARGLARPQIGLAGIAGSTVVDITLRHQRYAEVCSSLTICEEKQCEFLQQVAKGPFEYRSLKTKAEKADRELQIELQKCQRSLSEWGVGGDHVARMHRISANLQSWVQIYTTSSAQRRLPGSLMKEICLKLHEQTKEELHSMQALCDAPGTSFDLKLVRGAMARITALAESTDQFMSHGSAIESWVDVCAPAIVEIQGFRSQACELLDLFEKKHLVFSFELEMTTMKKNAEYQIAKMSVDASQLDGLLKACITHDGVDIKAAREHVAQTLELLETAHRTFLEILEWPVKSPDGEDVFHPEKEALEAKALEVFSRAKADVLTYSRSIDDEIVRQHQVKLESVHEKLCEVVQNISSKLVLEQDSEVRFSGIASDIQGARELQLRLEPQLRELCSTELELMGGEMLIHPEAAKYLELLDERSRALSLAMASAEMSVQREIFEAAYAAMGEAIDLKYEPLKKCYGAFLDFERKLLLVDEGDGHILDSGYIGAHALFQEYLVSFDALYPQFLEAATLSVPGVEGEAVTHENTEVYLVVAEDMKRLMQQRKELYEDPELIAQEIEARVAKYRENIAVDASNPAGIDKSLDERLQIILRSKYLYVDNLNRAAMAQAEAAAQEEAAAEWEVI